MMTHIAEVDSPAFSLQCPDENILMLYLEESLDSEAKENIDKHIEHCTSCSELLVVLAELLCPTSDSPALPLGSSVAHFELKDLLGVGGMGAVYEAFDTKLHRRVALKMLRPDAQAIETQGLLKARLLREARVLAGMSHPNILPVYEVGHWDSQVYIAMQLVEGEDLRNWLVRAQPSWSHIIQVFLQVAKGLHAAHLSGIVHRDIKPDNLLVTENGHVYLADFGLVSQNPISSSRRILPQSKLQKRLTASGMLVGTDGYIAPELYRGQPATPGSDQFSLCVSLYEAFYQQMPHTSLPFHAHLNALESGEIRKPLIDDVPHAFFDILKRGLHPIPAKRYPSVDALREALQDILTQKESASTLPEKPVSEDLRSLDKIHQERTSQSATSSSFRKVLLFGLFLGLGLLFGWDTLFPPSEQVHFVPSRSIVTTVPSKSGSSKNGRLKSSPQTAKTSLSRSRKRGAPKRHNLSNTRKKLPPRTPVTTVQVKSKSRNPSKKSKPSTPDSSKPKTKKAVHRSAEDIEDWWSTRPHLSVSSALSCYESEMAFRKIKKLHPGLSEGKRNIARGYILCLYGAAACKRGFQESTRYYKGLHPRRKAYLWGYARTQQSCPFELYLKHFSKPILRIASRLKRGDEETYRWCKELFFDLARPAKGRMMPPARYLWKSYSKLSNGLAQCINRYWTTARSPSGRGALCRKFKRVYNRTEERLERSPLTKAQFLKRFPGCKKRRRKRRRRAGRFID